VLGNIRPCSSCGGRALLHVEWGGAPGDVVLTVKCVDCGKSLGHVWSVPEADWMLGGAIEAWNLRNGARVRGQGDE
jgi:hypothetical protein